MRARSNRPSLDRRCPDCGSPLLEAGLFARILAWLPGRRCGGCRERGYRSPSDVLVASAEGHQDPFSLFSPENTLGRTVPASASPSAASPMWRMSFLQPGSARPKGWALMVAFGLGVAGGASPLLWLDSLRTQPRSSSTEEMSDPGPTDAPLRTGPSTARHETTVVLPTGTSSNVAGAVDRFLPAEPAAQAASASGATGRGQPSSGRRATPARSRVRTVRYPGRKPAVFRGAVAINTTPSGARISIDGTPLGSTPIRIVAVPAGSHVLRLEAEGRRVSASAIQVVADRTTRVAVALERTPSMR